MANYETIVNTGGGVSTGKTVRTSGDFVGPNQVNINVIDWSKIGTEFIEQLNDALRHQQKEQEELQKKQKPISTPKPEIEENTNRLIQRKTEL